MNASKQLNRLSRTLSKHMPTILTVTGLGLMGITVGMAIYKTPEAEKKIKKAEEKKGDKLTKLELIKEAAPVYAVPIGTGVAATVCFVGSDVINIHRIETVATVAAISDRTHQIFKEKTEQIVDSDKIKEIKKAVAEERIRENPPPKEMLDRTILPEDWLCIDLRTGQYVWTNKAKVEAVQDQINALLDEEDYTDENYVSMDTYCELMGLQKVKDGNEDGWEKGSCHLYLETYSCELGDGRPYMAIEMSRKPQDMYHKRYA